MKSEIKFAVWYCYIQFFYNFYLHPHYCVVKEVETKLNLTE